MSEYVEFFETDQEIPLEPAEKRQPIMSAGAFAICGAIGSLTPIATVFAADAYLDHKAEQEFEQDFSTAQSDIEELTLTYHEVDPFLQTWQTNRQILNGPSTPSPQDLAEQTFDLNFHDVDYDDPVRWDYQDHISDASTHQEAIDAANVQAERYGFRIVIPAEDLQIPNGNDQMTASALSDGELQLDTLKSWLGTQLQALETVPAGVIEYADIENIYIIDDWTDEAIAGRASSATKSIYISKHAVETGTGWQSVTDKDVFFHEIGHHIFYKLLGDGHINRDVLWQLAADDVGSFDDICQIMEGFPDEYSTTSDGELAATLLARIFRSDPAMPEGRPGVSESTLYMLSALQKALPDTNIDEYFLSMTNAEQPAWQMQSYNTESLDIEWQYCQTPQG